MSAKDSLNVGTAMARKILTKGLYIARYSASVNRVCPCEEKDIVHVEVEPSSDYEGGPVIDVDSAKKYGVEILPGTYAMESFYIPSLRIQVDMHHGALKSKKQRSKSCPE